MFFLRGAGHCESPMVIDHPKSEPRSVDMPDPAGRVAVESTDVESLCVCPQQSVGAD